MCVNDRWDKPSSGASGRRQSVAGTQRAPWREEDETSLAAHAAEAMNGVTFLGLKR